MHPITTLYKKSVVYASIILLNLNNLGFLYEKDERKSPYTIPDDQER
jgi:hypothetical protein